MTDHATVSRSALQIQRRAPYPAPVAMPQEA